jgi:hypothetical protein
MKSILEKRPKPLPPAEWDFSELKDEELQLGFFYEYGRSSDKAKIEVEKMRAARPHPRFWDYCPREHHLGEVLLWLAEQEPHFPEQPWLTLKANTIAEINKERAGLHWGWSGKPGDPVESIEWMVRAVRGSNVHLRISGSAFGQVWRGDSKAYKAWHDNEARTFSELSAIGGEFMAAPESSRVWGAIDWRATDAEIIERFKWLLKSRPAQFKDCAKTPAVQRGFDNSFPFTMKSALDWLGVLRRRERVKNWSEFFDLYPDARSGSRQKKHTEWYSEQARSKEVRFANRILDWFNSGTPLKKKDFR